MGCRRPGTAATQLRRRTRSRQEGAGEDRRTACSCATSISACLKRQRGTQGTPSGECHVIIRFDELKELITKSWQGEVSNARTSLTSLIVVSLRWSSSSQSNIIGLYARALARRIDLVPARLVACPPDLPSPCAISSMDMHSQAARPHLLRSLLPLLPASLEHVLECCERQQLLVELCSESSSALDAFIECALALASSDQVRCCMCACLGDAC